MSDPKLPWKTRGHDLWVCIEDSEEEPITVIERDLAELKELEDLLERLQDMSEARRRWFRCGR